MTPPQRLQNATSPWPVGTIDRCRIQLRPIRVQSIAQHIQLGLCARRLRRRARCRRTVSSRWWRWWGGGRIDVRVGALQPPLHVPVRHGWTLSRVTWRSGVVPQHRPVYPRPGVPHPVKRYLARGSPEHPRSRRNGGRDGGVGDPLHSAELPCKPVWHVSLPLALPPDSPPVSGKSELTLEVQITERHPTHLKVDINRRLHKCMLYRNRT